MDNAGNCNTMAKELKVLIPCFKEMLWRTQCFPHIINLIAKVYSHNLYLNILSECMGFVDLSFIFWKVYKWKKVVKVGKGTKRQCGTVAVIEEV
jgi:hypothetical protein